MARIAWLHLCENAFLDSCDRLCVIGMIDHFPVPSLPVAVNQVMIAGRLVDVRPGEQIDVGISIRSPSGFCVSPHDAACIDISNAGEYLLVTLRQFPLREEGMYRFSTSLGVSDPVMLDIPVFLVSDLAHAQIH